LLTSFLFCTESLGSRFDFFLKSKALRSLSLTLPFLLFINIDCCKLGRCSSDCLRLSSSSSIFLSKASFSLSSWSIESFMIAIFSTSLVWTSIMCWMISFDISSVSSVLEFSTALNVESLISFFPSLIVFCDVSFSVDRLPLVAFISTDLSCFFKTGLFSKTSWSALSSFVYPELNSSICGKCLFSSLWFISSFASFIDSLINKFHSSEISIDKSGDDSFLLDRITSLISKVTSSSE
jgi:hypothetical protein